MPDPQKSEVHSTTADAADTPGDRGGELNRGPKAPAGEKREATVTEAHVVRDDTEDGGPLVIESDDPGLQHIELRGESDAGQRTPEVDPPA
jgi:hypothetical protein